MKKFMVTIFMMGSLLFAQEAEISKALDALESNNKSGAKTILTTLETVMENSPEKFSPESRADYYFLKANTAADGIEAAKFFATLGEVQNREVFELKSKEISQELYFDSESSAEAYANEKGIGKYKIKAKKGKVKHDVATLLANKIGKVNQEAIDAYNIEKDFKKAGKKFLEVAYMQQALGDENAGQNKFFAANSFRNADDKSLEALEIYEELIAEGYTGERTIYSGVEVASGKRVTLDATSYQILQTGANKDYKDLKVEKENDELELFQAAGLIAFRNENYERALPVVEAGLKKFPTDDIINQLAGAVYYNTGKIEKYKGILQERIKLNPNNIENYLNLGYIARDNENQPEKAIEYFEQASKVNPTSSIPYVQMASVILAPDKELREIYSNNLGNSSAQKAERIRVVRQQKELYEKALPYLEKALELEPENHPVLNTLRQAYDLLGQDEKLKEVREKISNLQSDK